MAETTTPPAPRSNPPTITADELMKKFDDMDVEPKPRDWLLVDVRREDWVGGTIKTSLNMPMESFWQSRKVLFDICDRAGFVRVIFYDGNSQTKAPMCAGWLQDYMDDISKFGRRSAITVRVLKGGFEEWAKEFDGMFVEV